MPSPFPGMDPFLEAQEWEDFHATFYTVVREVLSPSVKDRYIVRVDRRVYVEYPDEQQLRRSDVAIVLADDENHVSATSASVAVAETVAPVECELPMPQERRESYLVIRERQTMQVVTVIETLSPANKRRASDGRREYLEKRTAILQSPTHLVEIDLLRGGPPLPTINPLPECDYYAIISRAPKRPKADVIPWRLFHPLPSLSIPLLKEDPEVTLDLQTVLTTVYDRARYDLSLDYSATLSPQVSEEVSSEIALLLNGIQKAI